MTSTTAIPSANDAAPLSLPSGYVGPAVLPGSNRHIWWTGRVAIGLRYVPPSRQTPAGRYGELLQCSLLMRPAGLKVEPAAS